MSNQQFMKLAIEMARTTLGQTSPNPVVGAVVVQDGQVVGMGAHLKAGQPHAEVYALEMAGEKAEDATLYVTLEPCAHHGKTPPCADLVIHRGIKKVFIASTDPNPLVAGKGIKRMKDAGIEVEVGLLKEEADELNQVFFHYVSTGLPYVTLKTATSLDGKTATVTRESKWITGEEARADVHQLRHTHDGILVGVDTVLIDNPSLTTRLQGEGKNPIRIILDTHLRTPLDASVVTDHKAPTWIISGKDADAKKIQELEEQGVLLLQLPSDELDLSSVLSLLGERGITSILVEGGATVHGSFLKSRLFHQVIVYIAPKLIGGKEAPTSFNGEGFQSMSEVEQLEFKSVEMFGQDIKIVAVPKESDS
ncbi:bifunctional diaminohydroxyphosphoribosylaminopyrimidine deaminase/5-amino-6-(5-phosphoribosylamino)uracil reductase RibD [Priestia koreensis]|uniref:bifunctional diaminohydroxyphosphoribosylaminopyrimidine deaminase/5-amino-6-(5-phosphoribosylamino)uracil reductase RibD n=1 Tax=Priestia koreensis TaxID=284581 RepID=UPI00203E6710|nr:bifunctional diaminohydroxyphosphoribosylaminopyrimidine deaminase/5-amino-6-(5-phosphoribosylamino)uracil reductase RibD [Priestia koreensis]MCM3003106.1 bifunctional diaminohydroxyphosphoribosylaminopyrimidine deaminase/5-amino-6-(5-phosphoribosylamino)uracil reductase RibD [Priestia koreensis]